MKTFKYSTLRPWLLAGALIGASCLVGITVYLLASHQRKEAAAIIAIAALVASFFAGRQERLRNAAAVARADLENLRQEVGKATAKDGPNYAWMHTVRYRPAFEALLRNIRTEIQTMELEAQALERTQAARRFWQSTSDLRDRWGAIAFQAQRSATGVSDGEFWSGAAAFIGLKHGLTADQPAAPGPRLVVNNR